MRKTIIIIISILVVLSIGIYYMMNRKTTSNEVPDGYMCVFHGGAGEITYETYVYKIDNGQANLGFKYVNTTSTTESWGSPNWNIKVTKRGNVTWTDDVFEVAKENGAYSYVTEPGSDEIYTIEEYAKRFLMN